MKIKELVDEIFRLRDALKSNIRLIQDEQLVKALRKLPDELRKYRNYRDYLSHVEMTGGFIPDVKIRVQKFFEKYVTYMDRSEDDFIKNFSGTYYESMCELAIANLLQENEMNFDLIESVHNESGRDFYFKVGCNTYYFECTTTNKSCLSKFVESFHKIDNYVKIAEIFQESSSRPYEEWTWKIIQLFSGMVEPRFEKILEEFKKIKCIESGDDLIDTRKDASNVHLREFINWIGSAKDAVDIYEPFLPTCIVEQLRNIGIIKKQSGSTERGPNWLIDDLAYATAVKILEKAKVTKKFDKPYILFVSLANASLEHPGAMWRAAKDFTDYFHQTLISYINAEKHNYDSELIARALEHLYAVIISTSYLDWFPDILFANMPDGFNNCCAVIYNEALSDDMLKKSSPMLFEGLILDQKQLPFKLFEQT